MNAKGQVQANYFISVCLWTELKQIIHSWLFKRVFRIWMTEWTFIWEKLEIFYSFWNLLRQGFKHIALELQFLSTILFGDEISVVKNIWSSLLRKFYLFRYDEGNEHENVGNIKTFMRYITYASKNSCSTLAEGLEFCLFFLSVIIIYSKEDLLLNTSTVSL